MTLSFVGTLVAWHLHIYNVLEVEMKICEKIDFYHHFLFWEGSIVQYLFVISVLSSCPPIQEERWWKAQKPVMFVAVEFPWRKESIWTPGPFFAPGRPSALPPGVFCELEWQCVLAGCFLEDWGRGGEGVAGEAWARRWSKCFTTWTSELWSSKERATWRKEKKKKSRMASQGFCFPCTYKP